MQFARDLDNTTASRFVSMYVNERTLDYGADGRQAIRKLLDIGHERGVIPIAPALISSTSFSTADSLRHPRENGAIQRRPSSAAVILTRVIRSRK